MEIKFIKTGSSSRFGAFKSGDTMRCDAALAQQLIDAELAVQSDISESTGDYLESNDEPAVDVSSDESGLDESNPDLFDAEEEGDDADQS